MAGAGTVLWIVLIVATGVMARRKGRSAEKWLLATAVLGPLAFLILLGMEAVPPPTPRPKLRVEVEITIGTDALASTQNSPDVGKETKGTPS